MNPYEAWNLYRFIDKVEEMLSERWLKFSDAFIEPNSVFRERKGARSTLLVSR